MNNVMNRPESSRPSMVVTPPTVLTSPEPLALVLFLVRGMILFLRGNKMRPSLCGASGYTLELLLFCYRREAKARPMM
jgi:hypothetical protein